MKQTRKHEILLASARLFRKKGYKATSLKDIAAVVGMEAPSLYNHISSKHELLSILLLDVAQSFVTGIDDIYCSSLTGYEKLQKVISQYIQLSKDNPDSISLITGEWVHLNDSERNGYIKLRDHYEEVFRKVFREAVNDGDIKVVNEDVAIYSILSSLRWLYSWISRNKSFSATELEKQLQISLLEGLKK